MNPRQQRSHRSVTAGLSARFDDLALLTADSLKEQATALNNHAQNLSDHNAALAELHRRTDWLMATTRWGRLKALVVWLACGL